MNAIDRYLNEVRDRIYGPPQSLERFEADLRARLEAGVAEGEPWASIIELVGTPEEVAAAFMADVELDYAGFFERVFSFLADIGALMSLCVPFLSLAIILAPTIEGIESSALGVMSIIAAAMLGLALIGLFVFYFPLLESHFGRTLGKRLMKIQVRSEDGSRIGLGAAFLRRLSFYFEILVLDSLFVPFTEKKQRAFDIVAKTVVVRDPGGSRGLLGFVLCLALFVLPMLCVAAIGLVFGAS